ncbi:Histone deacetylase hda1 [Linnemannia zychae]|nr:Histone deacetylase hda1 [Linnemannia zychae]
MHQQTSFIPPFVRDLIYFDRNQYSTLDEFISNDGLLILDTIQPCLPQAVIIGHIPSSSQPEDFDPFRRSCCGVLSKLEQLIQQRVGGNLGVPEESFSRLSDIYRLKELEPWLGEAGYRAAEVWLELFVRGDYNQAWLVGSTVLEQLLVNIIFTLQGPDKFIPFLVRDLLAMPCLNQSISPTLIAVIKTLMGSPLTLNIRNLLWHGFITPRDQIPLDAYGAMLIAMTMTIADEIQKKLRNGLSIRHGCPKTEFYFRQKYNKALDEDYTIDEMALDRFDAVYERVAYNNDRELPLLLRFGRNENQSHFSALLVIEALVHTSAFVTPGTTEQWTFALQHLALDQHTPATELLILAESRAFKPAPFMFVMASLPLLEHGLRLMYVRLNGCKADRSSALIAGEYYLTLDVILDQYVPPEYYETDAAVLKDYDTSAIPNRLCSALGLQAMIEEIHQWMRRYTERRFDEWSTVRKETVRALCKILAYPYVTLGDNDKNMEVEKNAAVIDSNEIVLNQTDKIKIEKEAETSSAEEIQLRLAIVNFLNKFVSNFERVKLGMIEAAWLDLTKVVDRHFPATRLEQSKRQDSEETMDTTGSEESKEISGVITTIEMIPMDVSPKEASATSNAIKPIDMNEEPIVAGLDVISPASVAPIFDESSTVESTELDTSNSKPTNGVPADTKPEDAEPEEPENASVEIAMADASNVNTDTIVNTTNASSSATPTTASRTAGLSPSSHTGENGMPLGHTAAGSTPGNDAVDDGPSTPMSGQSTTISAVTPRPQPDIIDGRSTKTGYVYDIKMRFHQNIHGDDDHPEDPRRIWKIYEALKSAGCLSRMVKLPSREATYEELALVHTSEHIQTITDTSKMDRQQLLDVANSYNSIYLNAESAVCARLSCGNLLELCSAVATGKVLNGVAIVRPPGHHAEPDEAGGFCLYNNVAIAARFLQKEHGMKKIFILDWDVHHGNGTQKAFIDDPDVVYCSIHRYDDGSFYPGDPVAAALDMVGIGKGRGKNINIPWPRNGMGDAEYIYAFHKVIMPIIYEFAPDFVLVSAGFDAAAGDHIGENLVSPAAYGHMTHMLKSLAGGKIVLALEGGYNLESIAVSGLACTKALLSDPIPALGGIVPNPVCIQTIHEVMEVQSRYWKSITPMYIDPSEEKHEGWNVVELSKVLGVYRSNFLYKEHRMLKLPISNPSYGPDFLDNVHCTGEFRARTMGSNNILRPDKSKMLDTVAQYVERIVQSGNELIDIVVPYQPATEDDKGPLKDKLTALLCDIWDNFVYMTGDTRRIILLAAGFGCYSMISFMNERQKDVARYVSCAVIIPGGDEAVPMVTKRLANWYTEHSFVVVADDHPIWEFVNQKMSTRTGNIVRSGRLSERLSESLPRLYNTIFVEIDRRIKALPPLNPPSYMQEFQEPNRNDLNEENNTTEAMVIDSEPVVQDHTETSSNAQSTPYLSNLAPDHINTMSVAKQIDESNQAAPSPSSISTTSVPFADSRTGSMTSSSMSSLPDVNQTTISSRGSNNNPLVDRSSVSAVQQQRTQPYPTLTSSSASQVFNGRSPSVGNQENPTSMQGSSHAPGAYQQQGSRSTPNSATHLQSPSSHYQQAQSYQQQDLPPQHQMQDVNSGSQGHNFNQAQAQAHSLGLSITGALENHHTGNSPQQQHQHQDDADGNILRQSLMSSDN